MRIGMHKCGLKMAKGNYWPYMLCIYIIDCNWDKVSILNLECVEWNPPKHHWSTRTPPPLSWIVVFFLILSIYRQYWSVLWSCCSFFWQFGKQQSLTNPVKVNLEAHSSRCTSTYVQLLDYFKTCLQRFLDFVGPFFPRNPAVTLGLIV